MSNRIAFHVFLLPWALLQASTADAEVEIGMFTPDAVKQKADVLATEAKCGRHLASVLFYQGFDSTSQPDFPTNELQNSVTFHHAYDTDTGVMVTLEPWVPLSDLSAGVYDPYLTSYATQCLDFGAPVRMRFAHEMIQNAALDGGEWYPWQDQPAAYVAAFRHVRNVFTAAGATNVEFVWCPNNYPFDLTTVRAYYPGPSYVDWLGMDGYNWGEDGNPGWPSWQWFDDIFYNIYHTMIDNPGVFGNKPILIGEFASAEAGAFEEPWETKAEWIKTAFDRIESSYPEVQAFYWLDINKERDWRVDSSPESLAEFQAALSGDYYTGHPIPEPSALLHLLLGLGLLAGSRVGSAIGRGSMRRRTRCIIPSRWRPEQQGMPQQET